MKKHHICAAVCLAVALVVGNVYADMVLGKNFEKITIACSRVTFAPSSTMARAKARSASTPPMRSVFPDLLTTWILSSCAIDSSSVGKRKPMKVPGTSPGM